MAHSELPGKQVMNRFLRSYFPVSPF